MEIIYTYEFAKALLKVTLVLREGKIRLVGSHEFYKAKSVRTIVLYFYKLSVVLI